MGFTCFQFETLSFEFSLGLLDLVFQLSESFGCHLRLEEGDLGGEFLVLSFEVDNALGQAREVWVLNRVFIELGSERGVVLSQVFILTTEDRVLVL